MANSGAIADRDLAALKSTVRQLDEQVSSASTTASSQAWWSNQDAMTVSSAVLVFGAVVIAIAAFSTRNRATMDESLRFYGTVMVITMAGFLVVAGYDQNQIAAPLGLLGTIAGYLLGKESGARSEANRRDRQPGGPDREASGEGGPSTP
jgi:uncharacterized membrane protein YfcA